MRLSEDYDEREIVGGMLKEIFRYGEDYVIQSLDKKRKNWGAKNLIDTGLLPTTYVLRSPRTWHFGRSLIVSHWASWASSSWYVTPILVMSNVLGDVSHMT